jgi:hypothetical protein
MDDVKFVQIFEGVEDLFKINKHIFFFLQLLLIVKSCEIAIQIFIVAILKNQIDPIVARIAYNVYDFDDVDVVAKFDQRFYLLTCEGYYFINFANLLDTTWNANYL